MSDIIFHHSRRTSLHPQPFPREGKGEGDTEESKSSVRADPCVRPESPSTPFLDLTTDEQIDLIHAILFGQGALPREEAITTIAQTLRDEHRADFQRLRQDGALWTAIDNAVTAAHKQHRIDKPKRGHIRAVIADAIDYTDAHWQIVVKNALGDMKFEDEEQAIRHAADWAKENCGLAFGRLRRGGGIWVAVAGQVPR